MCACTSHLSLHCTHCCTLHLTSHTCHINISFLIYRALSSLWRDAGEEWGRMKTCLFLYRSMITMTSSAIVESWTFFCSLFFSSPFTRCFFFSYSSIQSSLNEKIFQLQRETTLESVSIATWRARDAIHGVDNLARSFLHLSAAIECSLWTIIM